MFYFFSFHFIRFGFGSIPNWHVLRNVRMSELFTCIFTHQVRRMKNISEHESQIDYSLFSYIYIYCIFIIGLTGSTHRGDAEKLEQLEMQPGAKCQPCSDFYRNKLLWFIIISNRFYLLVHWRKIVARLLHHGHAYRYWTLIASDDWLVSAFFFYFISYNLIITNFFFIQSFLQFGRYQSI